MTTKHTNHTTKVIKFSEMRKEGWKISWTDGKAWTFLLISLIIFAITFGIGLLDGILSAILGLKGDSLLPSLVYNIIGIIFSLGSISFGFDLIKGIDAKVKDFWKGITRDRIRKGVLGTILFGIFILLGFVLFIIPGIIISVRLKFTIFAVIDKGLDPIEAIKYSRDITKGHFWEIILFDLYFTFFNLLGMLCLFIGLIRTGPMTQLATTRYYKLLSEIFEENQPKKSKSK